MYKQFLIYKDFYTAQSPSDPLRRRNGQCLPYPCDPKGWAAEFPELVEISAQGKKQLKVRLYKYTQSSTARILGLGDGGGSVLTKFISTLSKRDGQLHSSRPQAGHDPLR